MNGQRKKLTWVKLRQRIYMQNPNEPTASPNSLTEAQRRKMGKNTPDTSQITDIKRQSHVLWGHWNCIRKNEDLLHKLQTYGKVTTQNHLLVKRAKYLPPPPPQEIKISITLSKTPIAIQQQKSLTSGKILGRTMCPKAKNKYSNWRSNKKSTNSMENHEVQNYDIHKQAVSSR